MFSRVKAGRLAAIGAVVWSVSVSGAEAQPVAGEAVPGKLEVEAGHVPYFRAHAAGTQNYLCLATPTGIAWRFTGPQATLFVRVFGVPFQATTHFLSANPEEAGLPRATWQHSLDTSRVWARMKETYAEADYVAPGAIPWLLLEVVGRQAGPTGGGFMGHARFIQRINTAGGIAPPTGCSQPTDVGAVALVPYAADYVFFRRVAP